MSPVEIGLAVDAIIALAKLVERARANGEDITEQQMQEVFDRATQAEKEWEDAGNTQSTEES